MSPITSLSNKIKLLQLPTEILYVIVSTLKTHDLRNLSWTCRLLYHISRKYHFGVVSPTWKVAEIPTIDDIPISYYRDGVWFNDIFYLPIFYKENPICLVLNLREKPIKWIQKHLIVEPNSRYEPIKHYAAASIKNFIYIFGGENTNKGTTTNAFYELDVYTFVLRVLNVSNAPGSRMMHTLDVIDNHRLAMFGGRSLITSNNKGLAFDSKEFAIYNIKTKSWTRYTQESNIPYRRSLHSSCVMNRNLHIYGGQKYKSFSNYSQTHEDEDISVFDFRKEKWYKLLSPSTAKMLLPTDWKLTTSKYQKLVPGKRIYAAMFAMNNRIAILGGSKEEGWNNEEINRPWELMYLLSNRLSWEYTRIKDLPELEVLTFYWKSWNAHEGLFLIGKNKEGKLIMGWIKDQTYIP